VKVEAELLIFLADVSELGCDSVQLGSDGHWARE